MKSVYFIRHAKAADKIPGQNDFERDLADKGRHDAQLMAKKLKMKGTQPDLIVSSTALRALNTATLFAEALAYDPQSIKTRDKLYNAAPESIQECLFEWDDNVETLLLFGHNPGISELAIELSNEKADILPTCGIACFEFDIEQWQDAGQETKKMVYQDFPAKGIGK